MQFSYLERDLQIVDRYRDFLPDKVFDAHMHMYHAASIPMSIEPGTAFCRPFATVEGYREDMGQMLPGVTTLRLNMMPMLDPAMADRSNGFLDLGNSHALSVADSHPENIVAPFILPDDSEETIEAFLKSPSVKAFKCYCFGTGKYEWENITIEEFLPESLWRVANRHKMPIVLHIMRTDKLCDDGNRAYLSRTLKQYPDAKLILAHCGCAFPEWTIIESFRTIPKSENLWFDFSAICEPAPMLAAIKAVGTRRCVWGSDYPNSMIRGRSVSVGTKFDWLLGDSFNTIEKTYIGIENLWALYHAALLADLDVTDLENIFYKNALTLFDL